MRSGVVSPGQERGELAVEPLEELDLQVRAAIVRGDVGALDVEHDQVAIVELAGGQPELEPEVGVEVGGHPVPETTRAPTALATPSTVKSPLMQLTRSGSSARLDRAHAMQPAGAAGEDRVGGASPCSRPASG